MTVITKKFVLSDICHEITQTIYRLHIRNKNSKPDDTTPFFTRTETAIRGIKYNIFQTFDVRSSMHYSELFFDFVI